MKLLETKAQGWSKKGHVVGGEGVSEMKAAEVGKQLKRQPELFHIVAVDIERSNGSRVKQICGGQTQRMISSPRPPWSL